MKKIFGFLLVLISFFSCATKDKIVFFYEGREELVGQENILEYEPKIEENDVLRINVSSSSINEEIVQPFQMRVQSQGGSTGGAGGSGGNTQLGYLVGPSGTINFPVLGKIEVLGLTRSEIQENLETRISDYVKDPIVDVRIVNFKVTVLGEIGGQGRVNVPDGRITMPELIATAGGIPYSGRRENIMIIREENGVKEIGYIDMTDTDLFKSPYYYLKQNDIVYIEPNYRTVKSAGFFTDYQGIISVGTTLISLYLLINGLK